MLRSTWIVALFSLTWSLTGQVPKISESVPVNGKSLYYEVYGEGEPLIFLHGYGHSTKLWESYVEAYAASYEVYLIDLTGHGKSSPFKEKLSIKSVAQDLQALIDHLQLDRIKAIGFSFGGDVLYQLTLLDPTLVQSMITIGAVGSWSATEFPEHVAAFSIDNRTEFPWLVDLHESEERITGILREFKNYSVHLTDDELQSIQTEVLIMIGDNDEGKDLSEVARVRELLPESDLWVLPNTDHYAYEGQNKEVFIVRSKAFFTGE